MPAWMRSEISQRCALAVAVLAAAGLLAGLAGLGGCGAKPPPPPAEVSKPRDAARPSSQQRGLASWYGAKHHGKPTASGEPFDKNAMTAAHRKLKMGTRVRVTNRRNGRSVVVRINDRGPYGRAIIDVSEAAARKLDMIEAGVVPVRLEVLR